MSHVSSGLNAFSSLFTDMDAPTVGILVSLATAMHFITTSLTSGAFSGYLILGSFVVIMACVTYLSYRGEEDDEVLYLKSVRLP